jgi:hypothetical protein
VNFECAQYFQAADIIIVQGPKYRKRQILRLMDTSKKKVKGVCLDLYLVTCLKGAKGYALDIES